MIEERGRIVAVSENHIDVQTEIKSTCSGCQQNDHCGTGVVARSLSRRFQTFTIPCQQKVEAGQQVRLGIPEQTLLTASMLMYLLPLLLMLAGAILASWYGAVEGVVIIVTLLGAVVGFGLARLLLSRRQDSFQPVLLGVLPSVSEQIVVQVRH